MFNNRDVTQCDMMNGLDLGFTAYHGCTNCNPGYPTMDALCPPCLDATNTSTNNPSLQAGDCGWGGLFSGAIAEEPILPQPATQEEGAGKTEQQDGIGPISRLEDHVGTFGVRTTLQETKAEIDSFRDQVVPQIVSEVMTKVLAQIEDRIWGKIEAQLADLNTKMQDDTARFNKETNENVRKLKVWSDRLESFVTKLAKER